MIVKRKIKTLEIESVRVCFFIVPSEVIEA